MIQVLCANISHLGETEYQILYRNASAERRLRADRYVRQEDALRCVTADALLRMALGTNSYEIRTGEYGKPEISGRKDFYFNLSHSGSWVVLAFGDSQVGVDVETYRENVNIASFAKRFFTPEEARYCLEASDNPYPRFFQIWTGKESYLKYLGTGLQKELRSFSVFIPEEGIHIQHRVLPDRSSLSLCSKEDSFDIDFIPTEKLLIQG